MDAPYQEAAATVTLVGSVRVRPVVVDDELQKRRGGTSRCPGDADAIPTVPRGGDGRGIRGVRPGPFDDGAAALKVVLLTQC